MRKTVLRILIGIVTAPIWIPVGVMAFLGGVLLLATLTLFHSVEFAFSGKWEPLW